MSPVLDLSFGLSVYVRVSTDFNRFSSQHPPRVVIDGKDRVFVSFSSSGFYRPGNIYYTTLDGSREDPEGASQSPSGSERISPSLICHVFTFMRENTQTVPVR